MVNFTLNYICKLTHFCQNSQIVSTWHFFLLNVNKKFIKFTRKVLDFPRKIGYIIGVLVSTHLLQVLKF